jgi:hypothetical protein
MSTPKFPAPPARSHSMPSKLSPRCLMFCPEGLESTLRRCSQCGFEHSTTLPPDRISRACPAAGSPAPEQTGRSPQPALRCDCERLEGANPPAIRCRRCRRTWLFPAGADPASFEARCLASPDYQPAAQGPPTAAQEWLRATILGRLADFATKPQPGLPGHAAQPGLAPEVVSRVELCLGCRHLLPNRVMCSQIRDCNPRVAWFQKLLEFDCLVAE